MDPRWEAGSHLGSQVGGGILPWIPAGRRDPRLDPGWERWDPANNDRTDPNPAFLFTWVKLLTGGVYVPGLFA